MAKINFKLVEFDPFRIKLSRRNTVFLLCPSIDDDKSYGINNRGRFKTQEVPIMAEETQVVEMVEEQVVPEAKQPQDEKKYTDADVDAIIDKKFAKWKSEQEAEKSEAKKMAKMNEKEKADYEKQKLLDELQELKNDKTRNELTAVARQMFAESEINVNDDVLGLVVTLDAEQTKANVTTLANAFAKVIADDRKALVRQTTPSTGGGLRKQTNYGANLASKAAQQSTKLF